MNSYLLRRILQIPPTLICIYTILFALSSLMPGDPVCVVYGENCERLDSETRAALREELGINRPVWVQYVDFLRRLFLLDFGMSYVHQEPVADIISYRLPQTLKLMLGGMVIGIGIGLPLGIITGSHPNSRLDHLLTLLILCGVSLPVFWQGYLAQLFLTQSKYGIRLFPTAGYGDGNIKYMILPSLVLGTGLAAVIARILRATLLDTAGQDYIQTAHAKGLPPLIILFRHQLKNALIPVTTIIGLQIGSLMTGTLLVEIVFNWPGLGRALANAVQRHDTPVLMGILTYSALVYIVVNLIIDILYVTLDPRVRYE